MQGRVKSVTLRPTREAALKSVIARRRVHSVFLLWEAHSASLSETKTYARSLDFAKIQRHDDVADSREGIIVHEDS